jgi:hypothetical protein
VVSTLVCLQPETCSSSSSSSSSNTSSAGACAAVVVKHLGVVHACADAAASTVLVGNMHMQVTMQVPVLVALNFVPDSRVFCCCRTRPSYPWPRPQGIPAAAAPYSGGRASLPLAAPRALRMAWGSSGCCMCSPTCTAGSGRGRSPSYQSRMKQQQLGMAQSCSSRRRHRRHRHCCSSSSSRRELHP